MEGLESQEMTDEDWSSKEQLIETFLDVEGVTVEHPSNAKYALFGPLVSRQF